MFKTKNKRNDLSQNTKNKMECIYKMRIKAIFCYIGSKASLRKKISSMFPKKYNSYVEVFVGGGSIFFHNELHDKKVILNDLDTDLILNYRKIQKGIDTENMEKYNTNDLDELKEFYKENDGTELGIFVQYLLKLCNTFGGNQRGKLYKNSNPYPKLKNLHKYKDKLNNVELTNYDYKKVLFDNDTKDTLFYLDPPYEKSKKQNLYPMVKKDEFNFIELEKILKELKGKFILSTNDSEFIRELFKNYNISDVIVQPKNNQMIGIGVNPRNELIITNFDDE